MSDYTCYILGTDLKSDLWQILSRRTIPFKPKTGNGCLTKYLNKKPSLMPEPKLRERECGRLLRICC